MALQALQDVDYSHEVKSEGLRFRAKRLQPAGRALRRFRRIRGQLPEFEKLGLPPLVRTFGDLKNGLVLWEAHRSGKSTTLAALIDYINRTSSRHIISLEDPIEVVHKRKQSLVNQREVGTHTRSFASALRSTIARDRTSSWWERCATCPHRVHGRRRGDRPPGVRDGAPPSPRPPRWTASSAPFRPGQQQQVRSTLADSLRAVICQYLMKEKSGPGRLLAVELMVTTRRSPT